VSQQSLQKEVRSFITPTAVSEENTQVLNRIRSSNCIGSEKGLSAQGTQLFPPGTALHKEKKPNIPKKNQTKKPQAKEKKHHEPT